MIARCVGVGCVALACLTGGCSPHERGEQNNEQPLVAVLGGGGVSLDAPAGRPLWTGNFGSLNLCSKTGDPVTIESVEYDYRTRPVATRALVREVPTRSARQGPPEKWTDLGSFRGSLATLRDHQIRFTSLEPAGGATLSTACAEGTASPYTELITSMSVDRRGGWIEGITINYTSGGHNYDLSVDYTYVACGTGITDHFMCPLE